MGVGRFILVLFVMAVLPVSPSRANPAIKTVGQDDRANVMRVFGPTDPPYAFWRFCDEFPADCAKQPTRNARYEATTAQWEALVAINLHVNQTIEPVTDLELYGVSDYWTLPQNGKGDCEDYALLKRHLLIEAGWPANALLITVVRDEKLEGHAILTARTGLGDYILDNKTDAIKIWRETPYRFVMRQSYLDPKAWVALDPAQSAPPASIALLSRTH